MHNFDCKKYCYRKTKKNQKKRYCKIEKLKLVIFDMDGVLTDTYSSWRYIHDFFKTTNEKSVQEYIEGKIDDMEFIRRDANLWIENHKLIKIDKLRKILSDIKIMKGARETLEFLNKNKIQTAIVSAGLDILANRVGNILKIDHIYSNGLKTDNNGYLTGDGILKVKLNRKNEVVNQISKTQKISKENIISVGNSCFDIPMFESSGLGIAFNPSDVCVIESADYVIYKKDLSNLIQYLDYYII